MKLHSFAIELAYGTGPSGNEWHTMNCSAAEANFDERDRMDSPGTYRVLCMTSKLSMKLR